MNSGSQDLSRTWILFLALSNVIDQRMIVIQLKRSLCICCFIQRLWWILPLTRGCSALSTNISTFLELTGVLIVNLSGISSRVLHLSRNVRWFDIYVSFWCSFPKYLHLYHHVRFITIWLFLLGIFICGIIIILEFVSINVFIFVFIVTTRVLSSLLHTIKSIPQKLQHLITLQV